MRTSTAMLADIEQKIAAKEETRIRELEAEGMTRSDAQAVYGAERRKRLFG